MVRQYPPPPHHRIIVVAQLVICDNFWHARYPVQAQGVTVWSCRPTQSMFLHTKPYGANGPFHWSEARRQMAAEPLVQDLVLPDLDW